MTKSVFPLNQIAIISDIHGNLPALEAVLEDIRLRNITRIICLGDLVGKGPQPVEVIDCIKSNCHVVIQGNWDLGICRPQKELAGLWQQSQIGTKRLRYLKSLPFSYDFSISGLAIRCFHASAKSVFNRVLQNAPLSELQAMFWPVQHNISHETSNTIPDIVGYGDIHIPYFTPLDNPWQPMEANTEHRGRIVFNAGSVGLPYDGIPQSSYVIIEGYDGKITPASYSIQFIRVPYDLDQAVYLAKKIQMPEHSRYSREITTGLHYSSL